MSTEAWQMRSHSGYYLPLTHFSTVTTWLPPEIATGDEIFAVTAACGHRLSPEMDDHPPCPDCDRCEACCPCVCERCGKRLAAMDDCVDCVAEPSYRDDVDHTEGVLGDLLGEQTREVS